MEKLLNPKRALIFRIVHRENIEALLEDGLHCRSSAKAKRPYVQIGNSELIDKRQGRVIEYPPGGTLSDYVPFYFTPFSPMMYNIKTGYNGIQRRENDDIVFFVSSLNKLVEKGLTFVYSDRHAYLRFAQFTADMKQLPTWIDWKILQEKDFRRGDVDKFDKYQAEALVHNCVPVNGLLGMACHSEAVKAEIEKRLERLDLDMKVLTKRDWYFK